MAPFWVQKFNEPPAAVSHFQGTAQSRLRSHKYRITKQQLRTRRCVVCGKTAKGSQVTEVKGPVSLRNREPAGVHVLFNLLWFVWFFLVSIWVVCSPTPSPVWVWDFHVVAEQLLLVRSMASPTRLEEGWVGLPGQVPSDAAGTAPGQATGGVLGSCSRGAVDPWEVARRQRIPETPFSSPSQTTGSNPRSGQQQPQQQNLQPDPGRGT